MCFIKKCISVIILSLSINSAFCQSIPDSLKSRFKQINSQIEKNNGTYEDYFNRAEIYKSIQSLNNAISDYSKSLTFENSDETKSFIYLNRGNIYQELKEFSSALADYSAAIELTPTNSFTWNNCGYVYLLMNDYANAENSLLKSIEIDNYNTTAYVNLIDLYTRQKLYSKALNICENLIKHHPDPKSYIHKADVYTEMRKLNLALLEWNKAVLLSNEDPEILVERSKFKDNVINDYQGAVEDSKKAIAKNTSNASYYYNLTRPLYDLEEYDEVVKYCDKAISLNPNYLEALIMRANTLDIFGKKNEAKKDYFKAISIQPTDFDAYYQLSVLYSNDLKYDSAKITIDKFLKIDSSNYSMLIQGAKISVANFQIEKGIKELKVITKKFADKPDAFYLLGYLQDSIGKKTEACENMHLAYKKGAQQALSFLVDNCPILLDKSLVQQYNLSKQLYEFEQKRNYEKAIDICTELIKIAPDSAIYYYSRGKEYRYLNQFKNAINDYQAAIQLDSSGIDYWVSMAVAYSYLDQTDKAIETYSKALKMDPTSAMCYNNLGNIYASKNEFDKAIAYLNLAIEYKYNYGIAYISLGECYASLNDDTKACEAFKIAESIGVTQAFAKRIRYCNQ